MKHILGKLPSLEYAFCGDKVKIKKLTVTQVFAVQEKSKEVQGSQDENSGMEMIRFVIRCAVEGADQLSDDELNSFPVDELSKLSNKILEYSGLGNVPQPAK